MLLAVLTASLLALLSCVALGWLPIAAPWLTGAAMAFSVGAVATCKQRPLLWFSFLLLATGCWGALLAPGSEPVELAALHGGLARLKLEIARGGCSEEGCYCEAILLACSELESHSCIAPGTLIGVASRDELPLGAVVSALGTLRPRATFYNLRDSASWPDTRPQVSAALDPGSTPRIDSVSWLDGWVARARAAVRSSLVHTLRAPHAGIARALLLGEGAAVERDLNDAIRNAGVSHVLAVSGMHVTLLVGAVVLALQWLWLRTPLALHWEAKRAGACLGVLLAPLIARLCGGSPSAVRAAWTSTLLYLVVALGMRPSALSVSALVVCIYAALSPRDALHPGFVLSVLATAALLSHTSRKQGNAVTGALRESLRAWLSTAPFLLLCFGQTSLISLLANVALIPLGTALVPLAALHAGVAQLRLVSVLPSATIFELASSAFVEAARFCSSLDPGLVLPPLAPVQVLALTVVAGALMIPVSGRALGAIAALTGLAALHGEWALRHSLAPEQLRVTVLDVGQGDSILIETGSGEAALIDAGGSLGGGPDPGALAVLPLLRARRIQTLDLMVLSHPHPDHYGGLFAVLDALPVRTLWDTGQAEAEAEDGQGTVAQLLAKARAHGAHVQRPADLCGAPQTLGAARIEVLAPCPTFDLTRGPNDNSFVLRLLHGKRSFLFTGDVEREAEAALSVSTRPLQSDVLKVGHHGSRTSSTPAWLSAVAPKLALVSAGRGNRFGHPHAEVVERLEGRSLLLGTHLVGGIEVLSDGSALRVRTALGPTALEL